LIQLLMLF